MYKYRPKSADELLVEVPRATHPGSLSSRLVNDEHAAKITISNAASTNDDIKLIDVFEQIGIATWDFNAVEAVAKKEQALVDEAETKIDEEAADIAQEEKDETAAIEKAKIDLKLKYEYDLQQIEADGQFNLKRIRSKKGVVEEARVTLLKSSGKTQTRLKALVKIGRQGVATLRMAAMSSDADADDFELKTNRGKLVGMQRAWQRAQDFGNDGILKEEVLERDFDKDRMQV